MPSSDGHEFDGVVSATWSTITDQVDAFRKKLLKSGEMHPNAPPKEDNCDWLTIRLFISSTFKDMRREREVLVKHVLPELREWCEDRRMILLDCDMRWGIPKESTAIETIETCLSELDRCRDETAADPFFLNLLGERYGWVPQSDTLPNALKDSYQWVENSSITHMEIIHGALRTKTGANSLFCIRCDSDDVYEGLSESERKGFMDVGNMEAAQLKALKQHLPRFIPASQILPYKCRLSNDKSDFKLDFVNEKAFCDGVLNFFRSAIDKAYPLRMGLLDKMNTEKAPMKMKIDQANRAMQSHQSISSRDVIGRDAFVSDSIERIKKKENLAIYGETGFGKTSALASLTDRCESMFDNVFYHYVDNCISDLSGNFFVNRFIDYCYSMKSIDEKAEFLEEFANYSTDALKEKIDKCISVIGEETRVLVFVDNALDLHFGSNCNIFDVWNFKAQLVFTVLPDKKESVPGDLMQLVELPSLTNADSRKVVEKYFSDYNKRLDDEQMNALLSKKSVCTPLWLRFACDEMRLFGDFLSLTSFIESLPDALVSLIKSMIFRVVRENTDLLIHDFLSILLAFSRLQIYQTSIEEDFFRSHQIGSTPRDWASIKRYCKPFISYNSSQRMVFAHSTVRAACAEALPELKENFDIRNAMGDAAKHCINVKGENFQRRNIGAAMELLYMANERSELITLLHHNSTYIPTIDRMIFSRKLRCIQVLPQNVSDKNAIPMLLCHMCAIKRRRTDAGPLASLCGVCHCLVHHSKATAYICNGHAKDGWIPGRKNCVSCRQIVNHMPAMQLKSVPLCNTCAPLKHCALLRS